jgi:uncharacterized protein (TIGR03437 family)
LVCGVAIVEAQPAAAYSLATVAGSDYVGDNGPATSAMIAHIEGVALDAAGNLYIADADDSRIRKVAPGGIITTVAGTGHAGFGGDGGPATAAELNTPYGVAVDRSGDLFIADLGNARVREVTADGTIQTVAGGGTIAESNADGQAATNVALKAPRNVALDPWGQLYVSDFSDNRVYVIDGTGTIERLAGTGQAGFSGDGGPALQAELSAPAGLAVDSWGAVYVADSGNGRVRKIYRGIIQTLGDSGAPGAPPIVPLAMPTGLSIDGSNDLYIADSGTNQVVCVSALLQVSTIAAPARDVAVDAIGTVYAAYGSTVERVSIAGSIALVAGGVPFGYYDGGGVALNARFNAPAAVARDAAGDLYVADTGNNRVRKVTPDGRVSTFAGNGEAGFSGDGASATAAELNAPEAVAVDAAGDVYVADTGNNRVRRIDPAGAITSVAGTGHSGYSGDGGEAVFAQLNAPAGLAVDAAGDLYIADTGNNIIRMVDASGTIASVAGDGATGFAGDGGAPLDASLNAPHGLALDSAGDLYIADTGNGRLRRVSAGSAAGPSTITTFPDSAQGVWGSPYGLAIDGSGDLFLADSADQQVYRIEPGGRITTLAGDGIGGFNGESGPGLTTRLLDPSGLTMDAAGDVYVADRGNNRIRELTPDSEPVISVPLTTSMTVVNAASLDPGPVAPGEFVSLFGEGLGPDGTEVLFNGQPATPSYAGATQVNVEAPYSIAGANSVDIQVTVGGVVRAEATAGVVDAAPALFTIAGGTGQAAALNQDGTLNSAANPADRGSVVVLFATGDGVRNNDTSETPALGARVSIGGYAAELDYAGMAPGFPGLLQVNARVPGGYAPSGMLPVVLQVGTAVSQAGVEIAVK